MIHDLGCGTGSLGRWLAPRLDGPQEWVLHDHDPGLLELAAERAPRAAADGSPVTVRTRRGDLGSLTAADLAGASLVTASALLDVLTAEEIEGLAAACAGAGCPVLLALSVAGRVELAPEDPLDAEIAEAFNAHQRRSGLLRRSTPTSAAPVCSGRTRSRWPPRRSPGTVRPYGRTPAPGCWAAENRRWRRSGCGAGWARRWSTGRSWNRVPRRICGGGWRSARRASCGWWCTTTTCSRCRGP
ncbi:class I SAM-dependent methyltransferase [Streptomyces botrytidirepellens]|uniref:class I SAM-dependent methyltransferase n=1 Tax=Streptomyces botrytidirepellens TaxID=2486417 RepID=UPI003CCC8246